MARRHIRSVDSIGELEHGGSSYTLSSIGHQSTDAMVPGIDDSKNPCTKWMYGREVALSNFTARHACRIRMGVQLILLVAYVVFAVFAFMHEVTVDLVVLTCCVALVVVYYVVRYFHGFRYLGQWTQNIQEKIESRLQRISLASLIYIVIALAILGFVIWSCVRVPRRLVSVGGILAFTLVIFVFSKNPGKTLWAPYFKGVVIQFLLGILILRWTYGYLAFDWMGDKVVTFLAHTDAGTAVLFGEKQDGTGTTQYIHEFAFVVMPAIIFFGACTEVAYYYGLLQACIRGIGWLMYTIMDVDPIEAFVAAANIFLGPNSSAMTVAHFLGNLSLSGMHCVMTSGFSTVAGMLLGLYVSFGIPPSYPVAATVMSAPAALAVGKLFYPETDRSKLKRSAEVAFSERTTKSWIEAFCMGAEEGFQIVIHVCANLIAFVALLQFLNSTLLWLGLRVGYDGITFEYILSFVFYPLPYLMGVSPSEDCWEVSRVLGLKIMLTDIVGYLELGILITNRQQGLQPALTSERSELIAAYALCGFGSLPDIAVCLGALGALVPERKQDLARVALRAMIAGNLACYITACIAGILYEEGSFLSPEFNIGGNITTTFPSI